MFSPSAENFPMPGRLEAAPRSRCEKSPVLAMWRVQSAAILARSASQESVGRPLACRSALSRANSSWVSLSATVVAWLVCGAPVEDGAARVVLGGLVVGAAVVAAALVVEAAGFRRGLVRGSAVAPCVPPGMTCPTLALVRVASPLVLVRSPLVPRGRASAGIRNHASTSGNTISAVMRRLASQGRVRLACLARLGAGLGPEVRSSRTVPASRSEPVGRGQPTADAWRRSTRLLAADP